MWVLEYRATHSTGWLGSSHTPGEYTAEDLIARLEGRGDRTGYVRVRNVRTGAISPETHVFADLVAYLRAFVASPQDRWRIEYGPLPSGEWDTSLGQEETDTDAQLTRLRALHLGRLPWRIRNRDTGEESPSNPDPNVVADWFAARTGSRADDTWELCWRDSSAHDHVSHTYYGSHAVLGDLHTWGRGTYPWRLRNARTGFTSPEFFEARELAAWFTRTFVSPAPSPQTPIPAQDPAIMTIDSTAPASPLPETAFVGIDIKRDPKDGNKIVLVVNAKNLHDKLDAMGAPHDGAQYLSRPPALGSVVTNSGRALSTEVFLKREYPARFALSPCFSAPPTYAQLEKLCKTGIDAVRAILQHYAPIDISYQIHKAAK